MSLTRRQLVQVLMGGALTSLGAACQSSTATLVTSAATATTPSTSTAANPLVKPRANGADLTAVQASSELAQGRNRFAVGLIDVRNQPVTSGTLGIEFFKLLGSGTAEKRADSTAIFRSVGGSSKGIWVTPATFAETGQWGARVTLDDANATGAARVAQMSFEVKDHFSAPGYDEPAPRSVSLSERDVGGDLSHLCSNTPPCSLHSMSIADALAAGTRPLVVLFATPALCTSATCAPELQAVQELQSRYAEQANFIHVEIYQYPFDGAHVVKAVDEWGLPSDPWAFVVDRGGIVRDRFEGAAPADEIEPSLRAVLA